jgi:biotin carboxylase
VAEHRRSQPARLLVLGAGAAQLGLLEAAAARDVTVIAVDRDPLAAGFALADERAVISSEDEQGIDRLARARPVDGLISPGADWPVGIAARVAERLGLPHPIDGATAVLATTKTRQRERLAATGVLQPRTFAVSDPAIPFPCVVKAPDRQGQRGLTLVSEPSALATAVEAAMAESRGGGVLVEELIDGPELTVNAVSRAGAFFPLAVTDRVLADPPAFGVALAHVWPSVHATGTVIEAARAAVAALGIENGPSYTQIRLGAGGRPYVVEVAARLGGGHDAELCHAAVGVDLNDLAISFALGQDPCDKVSQEGRARSGGACVLFLVAPEGVLLATDGVEAAAALEGVAWVRTYRRAGWRFGPLRRGADRAGAILATGDDREDALARARRAAQAVRFLVDATPS